MFRAGLGSRVYAECSAGTDEPQDESAYNAGHIVHFGTIIIRDRIVTQQRRGGSCAPVYAAPRSVYDWVDLLEASGVSVVPVRGADNVDGEIMLHESAGWLCFVNCWQSSDVQRVSLCKCYCEFLMRDCQVLGRGCPEAYRVSLAEMRRQIAQAVADELC